MAPCRAWAAAAGGGAASPPRAAARFGGARGAPPPARPGPLACFASARDGGRARPRGGGWPPPARAARSFSFAIVGISFRYRLALTMEASTPRADRGVGGRGRRLIADVPRPGPAEVVSVGLGGGPRAGQDHRPVGPHALPGPVTRGAAREMFGHLGAESGQRMAGRGGLHGMAPRGRVIGPGLGPPGNGPQPPPVLETAGRAG